VGLFKIIQIIGLQVSPTEQRTKYHR